jgi:hypothetical protein
MRVHMLLLISTVLLAAGCVPKHELGYDMQRLMVEDGPQVNAALTVATFVDKRRDYVSAEFFGNNPRGVASGGVKVCINAEGNYLESVPQKLSLIISEHLAHRGVIQARNDAAPKYVLEGTLVALFGLHGWSDATPKAQRALAIGDLSTGARGSLAWLSIPIGRMAAIASGGTPATIEIAFADLQLRRASDGAVKSLPNLALRFSGRLPEYGHCETIYNSVNEQLKTAVSRLAKQIEDTLRAWPSD